MNTNQSSKTLIEELLSEFDANVNELRSDAGTEKVYFFGYKWISDDFAHTVTDWGNVRKFIVSALRKVEKFKENER